MTSVVNTSVKHFHSGMVGAPVLSGTAGAMIAVLDACLVNGFALKASTSLVVTGGVAKLSFDGSHGATVDTVISIAGVTNAVALNGEQKITLVGAGFLEFGTTVADISAAGAIEFKIAGTGWLKPFTGANLAAYRSADVEGTRMFVRLRDDATKLCFFTGYEAMTDASTGVGLFPTVTQRPRGGVWAKSMTANTAAVPWVVVSDSRMFYVWAGWQVTSNAQYLGGVTRGFGDIMATRPGGDPYACVLSQSPEDASIDPAVASLYGGFDSSTGGVNHLYLPRGFTGLGSAATAACLPFTGSVSSTSGMDGSTQSLGPFPSVVDGGLRLARKYLSSGQGAPPRGTMPGLYHCPQSGVFDSFKTRDILRGTGQLTGRNLIALSVSDAINNTTASGTGATFIDITGPWR